jgi:hypothetical protein
MKITGGWGPATRRGVWMEDSLTNSEIKMNSTSVYEERRMAVPERAGLV